MIDITIFDASNILIRKRLYLGRSVSPDMRTADIGVDNVTEPIDIDAEQIGRIAAPWGRDKGKAVERR